MDDRHNPDADCVARARTLIARAAKGVEQLEDVASQAFGRMTALTGMLARQEELARSRDPEAVEAAVLDAAAGCREAEGGWRTTPEVLEQAVRSGIAQRTWGRLRQLQVEVDTDRVVVRGSSPTYYLKQLALAAI